ncbi:hypothetical protein ES703_69320 [subsurface metagenome]
MLDLFSGSSAYTGGHNLLRLAVYELTGDCVPDVWDLDNGVDNLVLGIAIKGGHGLSGSGVPQEGLGHSGNGPKINVSLEDFPDKLLTEVDIALDGFDRLGRKLERCRL